MFAGTTAFSGFSVDDIARAKAFYADTLGVEVTERNGMLELHLAGAGNVLVYPKDDHTPATYTMLNFVVDDIDAAVAGLAERGVDVIRYDGAPQDDTGVLRGRSMDMGPDIAWFNDPAGNVLSVLQTD